MPRPEYLLAYYQAYYEGKEQRVTFSEIGRLAQHVLDAVGPARLGERVRILDFGGGDGSLAREIGERLPGRRIEILLVDYEPPADGGDERIAMHHQPDLDRVEGAFDLVLASAVLEHIPDAHPVIRRLLGLVSPGGSFYARTPWSVPLTRLVPGLDLTFPAHVHDLGAGFWNRAGELFGGGFHPVVSGPSPVATRLLDDPLRTTAAHLLKLPARLEGLLSPPGRRDRLWGLAGGWEVLLRKEG
jgi:SAM-dependent methyltransferase